MCRTGAGDQKPFVALPVTFGACCRHASTYQLRPERSFQAPFHAGSCRQLGRLQLVAVDHAPAPARLGNEARAGGRLGHQVDGGVGAPSGYAERPLDWVGA
jgi:hypothetical protein